MRLVYKQYQLDLQIPFQISKGTYPHRQCLIVSLHHKDCIGYGEITQIDYYGVDLNECMAQLESLRSAIENISLDSPKDLYAALQDRLQQNTFLLSALDCAAYDLYGKLRSTTIDDLLGLKTVNHFPCSYTLGIQSVQTIKETIESVEWPILKCKMGVTDDMEVLEIMSKKEVNQLRIDANEAWTFEFLTAVMDRYDNSFIEFIEQPLSRKVDQILHKVVRNIPIIADESFHTIESLKKITGKYDGINIKLMKCGGITAALEIIKEAKQRGLKIMLGCMTESSIGISAAAALGSLADFIDLDGALLVNDIAYGVEYNYGKIIRSNGPGLACGLLSTTG